MLDRPAGIHGILWDFRNGWYGLLLVLAVHQSAVAASFAWDVWVVHDRVFPILWPQLHPFLFAAAAFGTFHLRFKWTRARARAAHALMLSAYGIRALSMVIAAEQYETWTTTAVAMILNWTVLAFVAQVAWSRERCARR